MNTETHPINTVLVGAVFDSLVNVMARKISKEGFFPEPLQPHAIVVAPKTGQCFAIKLHYNAITVILSFSLCFDN